MHIFNKDTLINSKYALAHFNDMQSFKDYMTEARQDISEATTI